MSDEQGTQGTQSAQSEQEAQATQGAQDMGSALRTVPTDAIEKELDTSWRMANANAIAAGSHAGARNTVMTLVIYANNQVELQRARDALGDPATHAARAILLLPQPGEPPEGKPPVEAMIATHLRPQESTVSYSEEIVLKAYDGTMQHLPGTLLPLIVAGLPSYLWWMGEPPWRSELLESLVDGCDRLVVDTATMRHPEQSLLALEDLQRRKKTSCAVSDFNFTRQAPWRELIAQFFDAPDVLPYLGAIDHVSIEYAAGAGDAPANTAQAYLFAGWLASRLGWRAIGGPSVYMTGTDYSSDAEREYTLITGANKHITMHINARYGVALKEWVDVSPSQSQTNIPVAQLKPVADGHSAPHTYSSPATPVAPGALMLVRLRANLNGKIGSFTVARESDLEHAATRAQLPQGALPSKTVHLPTAVESTLLTEQLHQMESDPLYEDALGAAALMLQPQGAMRRTRS